MTAEPISRAAIIETLVSAVRPLEHVRAAWLGGSDASGRTDRWSDIDLQILVDDGTVEATLAEVHRALEGLSPIAHRHRLPPEPGSGYVQEFMSLRDASPHHLVDLVVLTRSAPDRFLEEERHGRPEVLFDDTGEVLPGRLDRKAHDARIAERLEVLREKHSLFQTFVTRAVERGQPAAAIESYLIHGLRPLVELLRIRHCPERFDYGLRYLDRDLPDDLRVEIESLALPGSLRDVESFRTRAEALFRETLRALTA